MLLNRFKFRIITCSFVQFFEFIQAWIYISSTFHLLAEGPASCSGSSGTIFSELLDDLLLRGLLTTGCLRNDPGGQPLTIRNGFLLLFHTEVWRAIPSKSQIWSSLHCLAICLPWNIVFSLKTWLTEPLNAPFFPSNNYLPNFTDK